MLPVGIYTQILPYYHLTLTLMATFWYRHPSRSMRVVGITGTKGKSSVTEYVNNILEAEGFTTAIASTIRFKVADVTTPNTFKMTMPGRFFIQHFLARARAARCDWAIIEMTSEGAKQFRHRGIDLDALIFTNIAPEHIESHGSFENYLAAKLSIGTALVHSRKRPRIIVANADDSHGDKFLSLDVDTIIPYTKSDAFPYTSHTQGTSITYRNMTCKSPFPGEFTIYNMLAAASFATAIGIGTATIKKGIERTTCILGRVQSIKAGQNFEVIVDYAHTPDSLEQLYQAYSDIPIIGVLGNTGGGRDTWKRPRMAQIAEQYCAHVILTDEDPYDENPSSIIEEMQNGMQSKPEIILDRRAAIQSAIERAHRSTDPRVVLITGKGTDPYIMRAHGEKEPWSDARVSEEVLRSLSQSDTKAS